MTFGGSHDDLGVSLKKAAFVGVVYSLSPTGYAVRWDASSGYAFVTGVLGLWDDPQNSELLCIIMFIRTSRLNCRIDIKSYVRCFDLESLCYGIS